MTRGYRRRWRGEGTREEIIERQVACVQGSPRSKPRIYASAPRSKPRIYASSSRSKPRMYARLAQKPYIRVRNSCGCPSLYPGRIALAQPMCRTRPDTRRARPLDDSMRVRLTRTAYMWCSWHCFNLSAGDANRHMRVARLEFPVHGVRLACPGLREDTAHTQHTHAHTLLKHYTQVSMHARAVCAGDDGGEGA